MPLMRMHRKKDDLPYNGVANHTLLATTAKLLDIKYKFYESNGDPIENNN